MALVLGPDMAAATSCPTAPWKELEVAHEIIDIGHRLHGILGRLCRPTRGPGTTRSPTMSGTRATSRRRHTSRTPPETFNSTNRSSSPRPASRSARPATSRRPTATPGGRCRWPSTRCGRTTRRLHRPAVQEPLLRRKPRRDAAAGCRQGHGELQGAEHQVLGERERRGAWKPGGAVPITRYFVRDRWGNVYVMHASGQDTPEEVAQAFQDAVLPKGWTKFKRPLDKDLVLRPAEGSDGSFHYLVIRDSADNSYHQIKWSNHGALQAHVQGRAMPIWGGQDANRIAGSPHADVIHGAGRQRQAAAAPGSGPGLGRRRRGHGDTAREQPPVQADPLVEGPPQSRRRRSRIGQADQVRGAPSVP